MWWLSIILSILAGCLSIYYILFRQLSFFKNTGIPYIPGFRYFINWELPSLKRLSLAEIITNVYGFNKNAKYIGAFDLRASPVIVVRDLELIKDIAIKHFDHFPNRQSLANENQDKFFAKNLFALKDDRWRDVRSILSPAFTSNKMKSMFKLISECGANVCDFLSKLPAEKRELNTQETFGRFTTDVIATCAFGISIDSIRNPDNEFYILGKSATRFTGFRGLQVFLIRMFPRLTKMLKWKIVPDNVAAFFRNVVATTIKTRDEQGIHRPDMIQLMMETRNTRDSSNQLTIDDMTAQAFNFFFGGFESTSTFMCFVAHEIAINLDIQLRLQNEIDDVLRKNKNVLTYEAVNELEYLDAVMQETLRMFPSVPLISRTCSKDFELPPALPDTKPFTIQKGMVVWLPIYAIQQDPKYFKDPHIFNPDRFMGENKKDINGAPVLSFGIGPRMCIGNRFALMETKILLIHLLARCDLKRSPRTVVPMRLAKEEIVMMPEGGFWLEIHPRKNPVISD